MGLSKYQNTTVQCPDDDNCEILCGFGPSCYKTTIICPSNHTCVVTCLHDEACYDTAIQGLFASQMTVECSGKGSCVNTHIYCPTIAPNATKHPCIIPASKDKGYWVWGIRVYAVNAWKDVSLPGLSITTRDFLMYCTEDYSQYCFKETGDTLCHCPETLHPTLEPSSSPSLYPSTTPITAPTALPTASPSNEPSVAPT
eukprot:22967_1